MQYGSGHIGNWLTIFSNFTNFSGPEKLLKIEGRKDNSCNHEPDQRLTALLQVNTLSWFLFIYQFQTFDH